jgi:hypothetical protein
VQVKQEFSNVARTFIKDKIIQPQLKGLEDTHVEEMVIIKDKLIEEVKMHQMAIQSLMLQIYRLQEGIELEQIRGTDGIRSE